jgi:GNAT superfamily N-acetyltransferase
MTPAGQIRTVTTSLEMLERPTRPLRPPPPGKLTLLRADPPTVAFYRFLYDTVGVNALWFVRRRLSDAELARIIEDPAVEIYVIFVSGTPAGYVELDFRDPADVEVAYLGVLPEFIGRGFGAYLLDWGIGTAWTRAATRRLWIHTCNWDHPRALQAYQKAGFVAFRQEETLEPDPRLDGTYPRDHRHPGLPPLAPA